MKQKELSVWLKAITILAAVCVLVFSVCIIPALGKDAALTNPSYAYMLWPCLLFFWMSVVPVLAALVLCWGIFAEIGRNNSFSIENAMRLRRISLLAVADSVWYAVGTVALGIMKLLHPGVFLVMLAVIFTGVMFAVVTAALSHLTRKAAELKDDADLTI